jgi:mycofactocin system glycosyltransferase
MMTQPPPSGSFRLNKGIRMIRAPGGGVLLQSNPLRALKINRAALEILEKCRDGMPVDPKEGEAVNKKILPFLDTFVQAGLLTWEPAKNRDLPLVSVIIPVYNRPQEIRQCLTSLQALDYPADKIEVIVVDDGSSDYTPAVVRRFDVRLIVQPCNRGQSAARNLGAGVARGEIIAFLDSDCIAGPQWLSELVPYFSDPRVALVGGFVDAYYREKRMDRYEQTCSALNMGPRQAMGRGKNCVFYVPTCNMLVRKTIYAQAGGLDDRLRVGEDVDLCWRLMAAGHHLLYIPRGAVAHKHRNRLLPGLSRRYDYGTSEAVLYARFPKVAKQFPRQPLGLAMILMGAAAYLQKGPRLSFPVFLFFYLAEHAFYQCGAFSGCLKQRSFRLYRIFFRPPGFLGRRGPLAKRHSVSRDQTSKTALSGSIWRRRKTA